MSSRVSDQCLCRLALDDAFTTPDLADSRRPTALSADGRNGGMDAVC